MQFIDLKHQYSLIDTKIQQRIETVLDHGQYIMGPEVKELEAKLAEFTGAKHAIAVASGTDALLIAMMALGIKAGDEIITTPFTFISTGEVIRLLGAVPVFIDIVPDTYNLDPVLIEQAITDKTKCIIPVSLYGQCADFDEINAIASKHHIPVIEDAAQSFGATYKGKQSCNLSTIGCTSFFPSKPLGCYGDGGACFTDDDQLAQLMKEIRVHGQAKRYHHTSIGVNGRIDTLQAAILLEKLALFPDEVRLRAEKGDYYSKLMKESNVKTPHIKQHNTSVYAQYTVYCDDRESLKAHLQEQGIPTAVHYPIPLHKQPVFSEQEQRYSLKYAEQAAEHVMSLPMHPYLTDIDQNTIANVINQYYEANS